jgi:hypothetical protein
LLLDLLDRFVEPVRRAARAGKAADPHLRDRPADDDGRDGGRKSGAGASKRWDPSRAA